MVYCKIQSAPCRYDMLELGTLARFSDDDLQIGECQQSLRLPARGEPYAGEGQQNNWWRARNLAAFGLSIKDRGTGSGLG